jgi:hypothetical protein
MLDTKTWAIRCAFSLLVYAAAAWGWKALTNGDGGVFWAALAWLVGIRLWFSLVDAMGGWIAWLIYTKRAPRAAAILAAPHASIAPSVGASVRRPDRGSAPGRA